MPRATVRVSGGEKPNKQVGGSQPSAVTVSSVFSPYETQREIAPPSSEPSVGRSVWRVWSVVSLSHTPTPHTWTSLQLQSQSVGPGLSVGRSEGQTGHATTQSGMLVAATALPHTLRSPKFSLPSHVPHFHIHLTFTSRSHVNCDPVAVGRRESDARTHAPATRIFILVFVLFSTSPRWRWAVGSVGRSVFCAADQ